MHSVLQVLRHSEQLLHNGKIVGEFVPPSSYISSRLLEYVTRRNAALASLQTKVHLSRTLEALDKLEVSTAALMQIFPFKLEMIIILSNYHIILLKDDYSFALLLPMGLFFTMLEDHLLDILILCAAFFYFFWDVQTMCTQFKLIQL